MLKCLFTVFSIFIFIFILFMDTSSAQDNKEPEYEMKTYYMVFLKIGSSQIKDTSDLKKIQAEHLANISKLSKEGKLVLAGPFLDKGDLRGIFILDVETQEEAEKLVNTDPAVIAGTLVMELKPWYGPVKLRELFKDVRE